MRFKINAGLWLVAVACSGFRYDKRTLLERRRFHVPGKLAVKPATKPSYGMEV